MKSEVHFESLDNRFEVKGLCVNSYWFKVKGYQQYAKGKEFWLDVEVTSSSTSKCCI